MTCCVRWAYRHSTRRLRRVLLRAGTTRADRQPASARACPPSAGSWRGVTQKNKIPKMELGSRIALCRKAGRGGMAMIVCLGYYMGSEARARTKPKEVCRSEREAPLVYQNDYTVYRFKHRKDKGQSRGTVTGYVRILEPHEIRRCTMDLRGADSQGAGAQGTSRTCGPHLALASGPGTNTRRPRACRLKLHTLHIPCRSNPLGLPIAAAGGAPAR